MALESTTYGGLHSNLGFTPHNFINSIPGPSCKDYDPAIHYLTLPAFLSCGEILCDPLNLSSSYVFEELDPNWQWFCKELSLYWPQWIMCLILQLGWVRVDEIECGGFRCILSSGFLLPNDLYFLNLKHLMSVFLTGRHSSWSDREVVSSRYY